MVHSSAQFIDNIDSYMSFLRNIMTHIVSEDYTVSRSNPPPQSSTKQFYYIVMIITQFMKHHCYLTILITWYFFISFRKWIYFLNSPTSHWSHLLLFHYLVSFQVLVLMTFLAMFFIITPRKSLSVLSLIIPLWSLTLTFRDQDMISRIVNFSNYSILPEILISILQILCTSLDVTNIHLLQDAD